MLTLLTMPAFAVAIETGSADVPGWVLETFNDALPGAFVVLRNDSRQRRRGTVKVRAFSVP